MTALHALCFAALTQSAAPHSVFCNNAPQKLVAFCESLDSKCITTQMPPFYQLVGEGEILLGLVEAVKTWRESIRQPNATVVIGAGRGTTGTHTVAYAVGTQQPTVHYNEVYYPNKRNGGILKKKSGLRGSARDELNKWITETPVNVGTVRIARPFIRWINHLFKIGVTAFFDTPITNVFAELYLATCPFNKVILTSRDSIAWAQSRVKNHGAPNNIIFVCPYAHLPEIVDPFSWAQCAEYAKQKALQGHDLPRSYQSLRDVPKHELITQLEKYDSFIGKLVPANRLLRVDLFSSKLLTPRFDITARDEWGNHNEKIVKMFARGQLNPGTL